ncbi:MAG TPA: aminodeoxychorismate/anthranilate synthase component II [Propylenella sp.]|jgi:anthranilate synthase/aminodeoxychorismate synthase-like glutamine amidotransferase
MILILDNYDSFVFNIARYVEELGCDTLVERNDRTDVAAILASGTSGLIISPGPCTPNEAGISTEAVRQLSGRMPILGICLGHQCIAQAFGGTIARAVRPMHGRASTIRHDGTGLFASLPSSFRVGRYHSLIVAASPDDGGLETCAWSEDGEIMAVRHNAHPTFGVQFHPESVLTEHGYDLLAAFLARTRA